MSLVSLEHRARQIRTRAAVRVWEYRQRHHAHGVWFRLRRLLTQSREAYSISGDDAQRLLDEGAAPEVVGRELAPTKTIILTEPARLVGIRSKKPIPLRLGRDFLEAPYVVLVKW